MNNEKRNERKIPRGTEWGRIELGLTEAWLEKTEGAIMKENKPHWSTGLEEKEVSEWERKRKRVDGQKNNNPHTGKILKTVYIYVKGNNC